VVRFLAGLLLLGTGAVAAQDAAEVKKAAELRWAMEVARDFLTAGTRGEYDQATVLLAADLKQALEKSSEPGPTFLNNRFTGHLRSAKTWSFGAGEIAPDMDESVHRGKFSGEAGEADFTVRVAKEKDGGKWRVNQFTVGEWKKQPAPPGK